MAEPLSLSFDVTFDEALQAAENRGVVLSDTYYGELQGVARQLAFSIAGVASLDQLQAVRDSLASVLESGQTFAEWKRGAAAMDLGLPEHRLDNIFRTNLQSNYMRGKWEQFTRNAENRPYLMYDAINDARVRPAHLAMDGVIRRWDDPLWKQWSPPAGYRCRCSLISLSEKQARARSNGGNGLNKTVGPEVQPDEGWDYNPFGDRLDGIKKAIADRREKAGGVLVDALAKRLDNGPQ